MCFSPEADLVSGIIITGIGIEAMRHVRRPGERALAALPVVLGIHQLIESLVWFGLRGDISERWVHPAAVAYLLIAFGLLPVFVPVAVAALEPEHDRRRMWAFLALGAVVSAVLIEAIVRGPVRAEIMGHHISYSVDLWHGGLIVALYVVATCGAMLGSVHRSVRLYGLINLIVVALLALVERDALISLWCAWAAVTSIAISLHLRHAPRAGAVSEAADPAPAPTR